MLAKPRVVGASAGAVACIVTTSGGIVIDGQIYGVPLSDGIEGLVYNQKQVPEGIDELADLWDPEFAGRATIKGSYALIPIATAALAIGIEDPMNMSAEDLDRAKQYLIDNPDQFRTFWGSASDLVNLFKSGEVVVASAGPQLADRIQDAGGTARWAPAKDGTLSSSLQKPRWTTR